MDFFEAQAHARRRSGRLVLLFLLALGGTIAATYIAACLIATFILGSGTSASLADFSSLPFWQPKLLLGVTVFNLLVVGGASLYKWSELRAGGSAIAELVGGRPVNPATTGLRERQLLNVVEEMALASGVPVPAVYILPDEPAINAFAAGYSPADAAIAVTRGTLERLTRDELQGVIAHEFSHILNGDMRINTRLTALVYGILALALLGGGILRGLGRTRVSTSSRRGGKGGGGGGLIVVILAIGLALLVIGYIGSFFGRLIQAAVSRQREFLADAAAVQFTRNPEGIGHALRKLGGLALNGRLTHSQAGQVSHFCFAQSFQSSFGELFSTHPPLAERIRAIDPAFDGQFTSPPPVEIDETRFGAPPLPPRRPSSHSTFAGLAPAALIATIGSLDQASVALARDTLDTLPEALRAATRDPAQAPALLCALLFAPATGSTRRTESFALVARHLSPRTATLAESLAATLAAQPATLRLTLLQLSAPALRSLSETECDRLLDALDALVHSDARVSPFEFALQKVIARTLGLAAAPQSALGTVSPNQIAGELSVLLSSAAQLDAPTPENATRAFTRAALGFTGLNPPLTLLAPDSATLAHLDRALDRLALTPAPFRKRILAAVATALTADSRLTLPEAELLRALSAALDCPMPAVPTLSS
jgi:Zn-dependent protease with chaperone function